MAELLEKCVEAALLVVWAAFCAGVLWEPSQRAGETFGRLARKENFWRLTWLHG